MPQFVPQDVPLQEIADALLARDDFRLRLLVQEWQWANPNVSHMTRPQLRDERSLSIVAAIVDLFALRSDQKAPAWISNVVPLPEPFFAMERAERPGFTRELCLVARHLDFEGQAADARAVVKPLGLQRPINFKVSDH